MTAQHTGRASRRRADAHNGPVLREATCGLADVSVGEANQREPNTRRRNLVTGKYNEDTMQPDEAFELTLTIRTPTGERKTLALAVRQELEEPDQEQGQVESMLHPPTLLSNRCVEIQRAMADAVHWLCSCGVTGDPLPHEELAAIVARIMCQDGAEDVTNKAWPMIAEWMGEERVWPKVEMP